MTITGSWWWTACLPLMSSCVCGIQSKQAKSCNISHVNLTPRQQDHNNEGRQSSLRPIFLSREREKWVTRVVSQPVPHVMGCCLIGNTGRAKLYVICNDNDDNGRLRKMDLTMWIKKEDKQQVPKSSKIIIKREKWKNFFPLRDGFKHVPSRRMAELHYFQTFLFPFLFPFFLLSINIINILLFSHNKWLFFITKIHSLCSLHVQAESWTWHVSWNLRDVKCCRQMTVPIGWYDKIQPFNPQIIKLNHFP